MSDKSRVPGSPNPGAGVRPIPTGRAPAGVPPLLLPAPAPPIVRAAQLPPPAAGAIPEAPLPAPLSAAPAGPRTSHGRPPPAASYSHRGLPSVASYQIPQFLDVRRTSMGRPRGALR